MADELTLLHYKKGELFRTALFADKLLLEYQESGVSSSGEVGNIYVGRVERVLPDVKAAFVRIGSGHNAFLPLHESNSYHKQNGNASLMSGQEIIVQVQKDAHGSKGALITRDITLPGQYVLLLPMSPFVGVSRRVTDDEQRKGLIRLGKSLSSSKYGLIMRHAALYASRSAIREEINELTQEWEDLSRKAPCLKAPVLLRKEVSPVQRLCRDYGARHTLTVFSNEPFSDDEPDWKVLSDEAMENLWNQMKTDSAVDAALKRYVPLSTGGYLVIDEREALHTLDLNTGSDVKAPEGMSLPLYENLAAVPEIARQIRLRNLSGIILVDFLDMDTDEEREQVRTAVLDAVSDDRIKTVVYGFTSLGLLEITRKRTGDSLLSLHSEECGRCGGTGRAPLKGLEV